MIPFRTGFGYDVHQFAENRKLIIGGVEIPFHKGLLGHSDADVLLHAITDAMLGALALGDLGKHFPDTDNQFKNADSKIFLSETYKMIIERGYKIGNIDATVVIEKPKLVPHISQIRNVIAGLLTCSEEQISIKATTSEKMGFVGHEDGVKAYANVLLIKSEN